MMLLVCSMNELHPAVACGVPFSVNSHLVREVASEMS